MRKEQNTSNSFGVPRDEAQAASVYCRGRNCYMPNLLTVSEAEAEAKKHATEFPKHRPTVKYTKTNNPVREILGL